MNGPTQKCVEKKYRQFMISSMDQFATSPKEQRKMPMQTDPHAWLEHMSCDEAKTLAHAQRTNTIAFLRTQCAALSWPTRDSRMCLHIFPSKIRKTHRIEWVLSPICCIFFAGTLEKYVCGNSFSSVVLILLKWMEKKRQQFIYSPPLCHGNGFIRPSQQNSA